MKSTVDPIVHGIRLGFAYGDIEFAVGNVLVGYRHTYKLNDFISMLKSLGLVPSYMQPASYTVGQRKVRHLFLFCLCYISFSETLFFFFIL